MKTDYKVGDEVMATTTNAIHLWLTGDIGTIVDIEGNLYGVEFTNKQKWYLGFDEIVPYKIEQRRTDRIN
jgi:ribosomal protein L21E